VWETSDIVGAYQSLWIDDAPTSFLPVSEADFGCRGFLIPYLD